MNETSPDFCDLLDISIDYHGEPTTLRRLGRLEIVKIGDSEAIYYPYDLEARDEIRDTLKSAGWNLPVPNMPCSIRIGGKQ